MDPFVEIEIESVEDAMQGQKIKPLVRDPIREKFYDMRSLAPSNPDAWHDAKLFLRQGKFMENFTDDYEYTMPLSMYTPTYQRLGYEQLRTYFSWRAKLRAGEFLQVPVSYLFLHIYELLGGIGVNGPARGLDKLVQLWDAYRGHSRELDESIALWLKDYHVYHELPHSFADFVDKHNLHEFYRKTFMFDLTATVLEKWAGIAGYELTEFYGEHRDLMRTGFYNAVVAMQKYFENRNESMVNFFYFDSPKIWWPFDEAVFHPAQNQTSRVVRISASEVYRCENGRWHTTDLTPYAFTNNLIGYFIMVMELALRDIVGFKGKAIKGAGRYKNATQAFSKMEVLNDLTRLFESAAKKTYQDLTRIVVTVDTQNLTRIREEAEVTQEKLIVDENISVERCETLHGDAVSPTELQPAVDNPWATFKNSLSPIEFEALQLALSNPTDIKTFANNNGIMLEILADGINDKAMDAIGDNILELADTMVIYDEYVSEMDELLCKTD